MVRIGYSGGPWDGQQAEVDEIRQVQPAPGGQYHRANGAAAEADGLDSYDWVPDVSASAPLPVVGPPDDAALVEIARALAAHGYVGVITAPERCYSDQQEYTQVNVQARIPNTQRAINLPVNAGNWPTILELARRLPPPALLTNETLQSIMRELAQAG